MARADLSARADMMASGDFEEILLLRLEEDPSACPRRFRTPNTLLLIAKVTSEKLS
jgi:hypothetical protein